jgi:hypothetical protein
MTVPAMKRLRTAILSRRPLRQTTKVTVSAPREPNEVMLQTVVEERLKVARDSRIRIRSHRICRIARRDAETNRNVIGIAEHSERQKQTKRERERERETRSSATINNRRYTDNVVRSLAIYQRRSRRAPIDELNRSCCNIVIDATTNGPNDRSICETTTEISRSVMRRRQNDELAAITNGPAFVAGGGGGVGRRRRVASLAPMRAVPLSPVATVSTRRRFV